MKIPLTKWRADKLTIEYSMLIVSHSAQSVTFNIFFNPKGEYKTIVCITICTVLLHIMGLYPPRISLQSSTLMIVTPFKNVFPNLNITYWKVTISNEDFSGIETKSIESNIFPGSLYIYQIGAKLLKGPRTYHVQSSFDGPDWNFFPTNFNQKGLTTNSWRLSSLKRS